MRIRTAQGGGTTRRWYVPNVTVEGGQSVAPVALPCRTDDEWETNGQTREGRMYSLVANEETRTRRRQSRPPTWGGLVAATLFAVAIPVVLWMVTNPVPGAVVAGTVAVVTVPVGVRRLTAGSRVDGSRESAPLAPVRTGRAHTRR